jgi:hypothetical protein
MIQGSRVGCIGFSVVAEFVQRTLFRISDQIGRKLQRSGATGRGVQTEAAEPIFFEIESDSMKEATVSKK